jgi:hypothetical protein
VRSSQPPTVATWLLRQFGCGPRNGAILGDLMEQYGQGRSRSWYWRQVFMAVGESFITEIRLHKLLLLRALVIGTAFKIASSYSMAVVIALWSRDQRPWNNPNVPIFGVAATLVLCGYTGRLLAAVQKGTYAIK